MPNPITSHQVPTLLIKMKYPKQFDGVALCIGAFIPDFTYFCIQLRHISHSILGQLYWTLPLTLILTPVFYRYLAPLFSKLAEKDWLISKPLRFFGVDELNILKKKKFDGKFFLITSYSALIGGLTHLLLDIPSHGYIELFYPWIILKLFDIYFIPIFDFSLFPFIDLSFLPTIKIAELIWIIEELTLLFISLYLFRYIKKNQLIKSWNESNSK